MKLTVSERLAMSPWPCPNLLLLFFSEVVHIPIPFEGQK
jgi:hypothetical protein